MKSLTERFREIYQVKQNEIRLDELEEKRTAIRSGDIEIVPQFWTENDPALYNEDGLHVTDAKLLPTKPA